jgi:hypothetical protein
MSQRRFGATGKFPQGKVHKSDEGELSFGIAADHAHGVVVLSFGKPVAWLGMPPANARALGEKLIEMANRITTRMPPQ